ncbi:MAG TPA: hypothetical protein VMG08_15320 [Allosphingosinicella sp.]|nr:hypothetical protein [Allosphingosinicella sp.]
MEAGRHVVDAREGVFERTGRGRADDRVAGDAVELGEKQGNARRAVIEGGSERPPAELLDAAELVIDGAEPVAAAAVPDGVADEARADLEGGADARRAEILA